MAKVNDGGPAFPQHVAPAYRQEPEIWGMSLRDWFAATMPLDAESPSPTQAKALMGEPLPDHNVWAERPLEAIRWHATAEAKLRFLRADAMLAARAEGGAE